MAPVAAAAFALPTRTFYGVLPPRGACDLLDGPAVRRPPSGTAGKGSLLKSRFGRDIGAAARASAGVFGEAGAELFGAPAVAAASGLALATGRRRHVEHVRKGTARRNLLSAVMVGFSCGQVAKEPEVAMEKAKKVDTRRFSVRIGESEIPVALTTPLARNGGGRHPLVVFTRGFATHGAQYDEFAESLAEGGCAVSRYDPPFASHIMSDVEQVQTLRSLLDHVGQLSTMVNPEQVLLAGHSRGAKISSLTAMADERVKGLCMLDPVDSFKYTKGLDGFPSACDALREIGSRQRMVPTAIVGAGTGSECAPGGANYRTFFEAASGPVWLLEIPGAGHAQFLDRDDGMASMQRAFCGCGGADNSHVIAAASAATLAWTRVVFDSASRNAHGKGPQAQTRCQEKLVKIANEAATQTAECLERRGLQVNSVLKM